MRAERGNVRLGYRVPLRGMATTREEDVRGVAAPRGPAAPRRPRQGQAALVVLYVGTAGAVVLHVFAGFRYPVPWPDEAHFLQPALQLVRHLTLAAPQLNAPDGIFWMPDGYAVAMGAAFAVLPDTVAVARLLSLLSTLAFAGCLWVLAARLGAVRLPTACALATWLVAPRVVLMANIARMEALVLVLVGGALLAAATRRWPAALAISSLTVLVHPAGAVLLVAFAVAAVLFRVEGRPSGRVEVTLLVLVGAAWVAEALWLLAHLDLVRDHLAFQLARKGSRSQGPNATELLVGLGAIAGLVASLATRERLGRSRAAVLGAVFALVGAFAAIRVTGNEMWYGVLGYETAALLAVIASCAAAPRLLARRAVPPAFPAVLAVVPVLASAAITLGGSAYEMSLHDGPPAAFFATIEHELRAFDERQTGPVLVAFDRSSGLSPFLLDQRWRHLRFVDPTPVTPLSEQPDYVLYSLGPPEPGRQRIAARLPESAPVLRIALPGSTVEVLLYPGDRVEVPVT